MPGSRVTVWGGDKVVRGSQTLRKGGWADWRGECVVRSNQEKCWKRKVGSRTVPAAESPWRERVMGVGWWRVVVVVRWGRGFEAGGVRW